MRCTLRPWDMEDAGPLALLCSNLAVQNNLRDGFPYPYTKQDGEAFLASVLAADPQELFSFAILADGQLAGSITAYRQVNIHRRIAELGYYLGEPYWGKGIMTWAVREVCREAFEKLDIVRIYAESYAHNMGSRRVLEKAGFVQEGTLRQSVYKNGQMYDACIYALLKEESGRAGGECP